MILYYIDFDERFSEDLVHAQSFRTYFTTKQKAEIAWKKHIRDAKSYNKFPMPHQLAYMEMLDGGYEYAKISKDEIIYNAPKVSHWLVKDNVNWQIYNLTIRKPKKIDLGKNKKDIAWKLSSISSSSFQA